MKNNPYNLLRSKEIIAILDGDSRFGDYSFGDSSKIEISMPYLSGPDLCNLSTKFGLAVRYKMDGDTLSRWKYLDNLLDFCIKNDSCSSLLTHMFSIEGFSKMFEGQSADDIKDAHKKIVSAILGKINGRLLFSKSEIVVIGDKFLVRPIDSEIELEAPTIKTIDVEFIKSLSSRAINDIEQGNFDSSITKSRTLLEETFCYALENKGMKSNNKGDIGKQFKEVRELYDMHSDSDTDKRVKTLLSGLNNIVSAITEMRNRNSDAHVIGASRVKIKEHHARLFLNSSITISEFILSVVKND